MGLVEDCDPNLETFFVYKSLHSDDSWGAVIVSQSAKLPNSSFLMKVYAVNEKEAIVKGQEAFNKINKRDRHSDLRFFVSSALQSIKTFSKDRVEIAKQAVELGGAVDKAFDDYLTKNEGR